jgi:acyl carrier protein
MEESRMKIRTFLAQYIRNNELRDDLDIFASGFVNSLFAMQIVLFVEGEFGISLGSDDLKLDNFRSVDALTGLVARKMTG